MASRIGNAVGKLLRRIDRRNPSNSKSGRNPPPPAAPSRTSALDGAFIEYNPDLDGNADPGEVVWTWVPWEEDPTKGKDRPVVILGQRDGLLIGVPLTSKQRDDERQVAVGAGPWDSHSRPSFAKIERVLEVDPGQVRREGAILPRSSFDDIVRALRRL